jgi:tetratricopeptide (TPR) repeat protein
MWAIDEGLAVGDQLVPRLRCLSRFPGDVGRHAGCREPVGTVRMANAVGEPPSPYGVRTVAELGTRLRALRAWSGLSYREIHRRVVQIRRRRGMVELPALDTVHRCLRPGRARLDADLVADIAMAMLGDATQAAAWRLTHQMVSGRIADAAIVTVQEGLPQDSAQFTGRHAELAELLDGVDAPRAGGVWALTGMAGVGKTTLAVHAAHRLAPRFGDLQLTVQLRGHDRDRSPADPAAVLDALLRRLGCPLHHIQGLDLRRRMTMYRELLAGRRVLILLDDASSEDQVQPLVPDSPTCLVLATSRHRLTGLPTVHLDVFPPADSLALLRRSAGEARIDADPASAARIADLAGHLPLALALVASRIRDTPDWTLADHLERLTDHGHTLRLDGAVELGIDQSYSALRAETRRVLRLLSLHPGDDCDIHAAAALAGDDPTCTGRRLADLITASLVQQRVPGRYGLHDLVRIFARRRASDEESPTALRAAVGRLLDHYREFTLSAMHEVAPQESRSWSHLPYPPTQAPAIGDRPTAAAWLDAECANVIAAAVYGAGHGWPRHATDLSLILSRYLLLSARHHDALTLHEAASRVADGADLGRTLTSLAGAYGRLGRLADSLDCCQRALTVFRDLGDRPGETNTLINLGAANWRLGRYLAALGAFQQVVQLAYETGDRLAEFYGRGGIGCVWWRLGRHAEALDEHRRSLTIAREIGERAGEGEALQRIGRMHFELHELEPAESRLVEALAIAVETGDRVSESDALYQLGSVHRQRGRLDEALRHQHQALSIAQEIADPSLQVEILVELTDTERRAGRYSQAIRHGSEAASMAESLGARHELARAHDLLARCHLDQHDLPAARQHWRHALALHRDMGTPDADQIATNLESITQNIGA